MRDDVGASFVNDAFIVSCHFWGRVGRRRRSNGRRRARDDGASNRASMIDDDVVVVANKKNCLPALS